MQISWKELANSINKFLNLLNLKLSQFMPIHRFYLKSITKNSNLTIRKKLLINSFINKFIILQNLQFSHFMPTKFILIYKTKISNLMDCIKIKIICSNNRCLIIRNLKHSHMMPTQSFYLTFRIKICNLNLVIDLSQFIKKSIIRHLFKMENHNVLIQYRKES